MIRRRPRERSETRERLVDVVPEWYQPRPIGTDDLLRCLVPFIDQAWPRGRPSNRRPGSEDPCRSLSLSLSLFFPFAASRLLLSFLFLLQVKPACMADAKPPCQLSMHHLDEPNSCSSTRPDLSDTLSFGRVNTSF